LPRTAGVTSDFRCDRRHELGWFDVQCAEPLDQLDDVESPRTAFGFADDRLVNGKPSSQFDLRDCRRCTGSAKLGQEDGVLFGMKRTLHGGTWSSPRFKPENEYAKIDYIGAVSACR
jgi:hypothetical protein